MPRNLTARLCLTFLLLSSTAIAGDWPQILGPSRNGHAVDEKLAANWNDAKPEQIWSYKVGEGYAGPAIVDGRVYLFHRGEGDDKLTCLSAEKGNEIWNVTWPAKYAGGYNSDQGPRCVPVLSKERVYVFSAAGDLHCTNLAGKKLWSRRLGKDYKAQDGYFGFGSSPLIINGRILVNVGGGKSGAGIVGLDAQTGETKWKQFEDAASYASPIVWTAKERDPVAVFVTRFHAVGIRPNNGETVFQLPFGARGTTVNAATPVAIGDDRFFVTASYRIGAKAFSVNGTDTQVIWENDTSLSSQYPTPIYWKEHLYGNHGREDGAPAALRCVEAATGKVTWEESGVGMAHLIAVDGKLLMQTVEGELVLLSLNSESYNELGRVRLSKATTRALPALANGLYVVRDTNGNLTAWTLP